MAADPSNIKQYSFAELGKWIIGLAINKEITKTARHCIIKLKIPFNLEIGFLFVKNFSLKFQRYVLAIVCSVYLFLII